MKVKLDDFYLGVLINGLNTYKSSYATEQGFADFLLRLVDEYEKLKPNHKVKLTFTPDEIKIIRECLITWRNDEIKEKKDVSVEVISETLEKFI